MSLCMTIWRRTLGSPQGLQLLDSLACSIVQWWLSQKPPNMHPSCVYLTATAVGASFDFNISESKLKVGCNSTV